MLDNGGRVVHPHDATGLLLDLGGGLPGLVDVLHGVVGELGHVLLDVFAPGVGPPAVLRGVYAVAAIEDLFRINECFQSKL